MCEEYCLSESVNFQQHKQKSDFSTYFGRWVFDLLRKGVGNQNLEVRRILVPPEILVAIATLAKFKRHCICSTE